MPHKHAYISFSHKDQTVVDQIKADLEAAGIDILIEEYWPKGQNYLESIRDFLNQCDVFLVMVSNNSMGSPWPAREIWGAYCLDKPIIPVGLDPVNYGNLQGIEWEIIKNIPFINLHTNYQPNLQKLIKAIES